MTQSPLPGDHALARRAILKGAGIGAGLASGLASAAQAQTPADAPVWSAEYWARKRTAQGEIKLNLRRKRAGAPRATTPPSPRRSSPRSPKFGDQIPTGTYLDMAATMRHVIETDPGPLQWLK
jgi:hypothetical protein